MLLHHITFVSVSSQAQQRPKVAKVCQRCKRSNCQRCNRTAKDTGGSNKKTSWLGARTLGLPVQLEVAGFDPADTRLCTWLSTELTGFPGDDKEARHGKTQNPKVH